MRYYTGFVGVVWSPIFILLFLLFRLLLPSLHLILLLIFFYHHHHYRSRRILLCLLLLFLHLFLICSPTTNGKCVTVCVTFENPSSVPLSGFCETGRLRRLEASGRDSLAPKLHRVTVALLLTSSVAHVWPCSSALVEPVGRGTYRSGCQV